MPERTFGAITLRTSNEDKVFFPKDGITKGDLIDYYVRAAEHILPLIKDRPLTLFRRPDGIDAEGFVQQQVQDHFPDWIPTATVERRGKGDEVTHPLADKAADLAFFADQGTVTLHAWLSRKDQPEIPDTLVFDLDPPEEGGFDLVRQGARDVRQLLEELGLAVYLKTTGSKGLHLLAPLRRERGFDEVRKFARSAADLLARRKPGDYTTEQYKKDRDGRLYLDTARNAYGQTIVAAYAVRAKPGAPVAMPLSWDEAGDSSIGPRSFTIENAFKRLGQKDDPWAGMRRHARGLDGPMNKLKKLMHEAGLETQ
jgi:bifunctional non-homologous end joining protein LigD